MSSAWSVHVIFFQLSSLCNNFKIHKMFFLEKTHCYKGQHSYSSSVHKNKLSCFYLVPSLLGQVDLLCLGGMLQHR